MFYNEKCMASKGLIAKNYQNMINKIENNTPETPQQPLLAIHGVMPRCSLCKFWKQTTFYEYSVNEGNCDKLNETDKVSINLHLGWDGGYVNDIETEADFYCALFSYNGA